VSKRKKILSIDGGGIRGILPATFLCALEQKLREEGGDENLKIGDCFDIMAGTSTGGFMSSIYLIPDEHNPLKPKYSAKQALDLYSNYGNSVFTPSTNDGFHKYSSEGLEKEFRLFFKEIKLSQLIKPCCITAYDIIQSEPYVFMSDKATGEPRNDFFIRDVSRATSALPGIFPPATIHSLAGRGYTFVDGSLFAYNPAMYGYMHAKELFPEEEYFLLSLGTGIATSQYSEEQLQDSSKMNWANILANIAFAAHSDIVNYELEEIFKARINSTYIRLQPPLLGINKEMDDITPENIRVLQNAGMEFVKSNEKPIATILEMMEE
jgi:uncharacterized protein